jgi:hypothetical protein
MNGIMSHIYKEGNQVVNALANHGDSLSSFTFWLHVPEFIKDYFVKNQLDLPSFRSMH